MLDVTKLKEYGANTEEGLKRCMGSEDFYLRLVKMSVADSNFELLFVSAKNNDVKTAFEAAHALKGVLGNLELTPIFTPVNELTELLRPLEPCDMSGYIETIEKELKRLQDLINEE